MEKDEDTLARYGFSGRVKASHPHDNKRVKVKPRNDSLLTRYASTYTQRLLLWFASTELAVNYVKHHSPKPETVCIAVGTAAIPAHRWDCIIIHTAGMDALNSRKFNKFLNEHYLSRLSVSGKYFFI